MDSTLHPVRPARLLAAPGVGIATALMLAAVRPSPPPEYQPLVVFPGADDRAAAEPSTVIPMGPARVVSRALTTDTRDFDATLWLEDKEGERHLTQQVTLRGQNILSTHDFSDSQLLPGPYTLFVEVCPVSILSALPYYVPCQTLQTDLTLQA